MTKLQAHVPLDFCEFIIECATHLRTKFNGWIVDLKIQKGQNNTHLQRCLEIQTFLKTCLGFKGLKVIFTWRSFTQVEVFNQNMLHFIYATNASDFEKPIT